MSETVVDELCGRRRVVVFLEKSTLDKQLAVVRQRVRILVIQSDSDFIVFVKASHVRFVVYQFFLYNITGFVDGIFAKHIEYLSIVFRFENPRR